MSDDKSGDPTGDAQELQVLLASFGAVRSEIAQRINQRSQFLALQATVMLGAFVYVLSHEDPLVAAAIAMCLPAASLLFHCVHVSEDVHIKRLGAYVARVLEPELAKYTTMPLDQFYETSLRSNHMSPVWRRGGKMRRAGNTGLPALVLGAAAWVARPLLAATPWLISLMLLYLVALVYLYLAQQFIARHRARRGAKWPRDE